MRIRKYLQQSPVFALNSTVESVLTRVNSELRREHVNLLQGLVLTALFFEGDSALTPSELADEFRTSRGNMSHILSHLEAKGWVKRAVNPEDARKFSIELRPEGRKKAVALIKYFDRIQEHFETELGVAGCSRLSTDLQKMTYPLSGPRSK